MKNKLSTFGKIIASGHTIVSFIEKLPIMNRITNQKIRMLIFYAILAGFAFAIDYSLLYVFTDLFGIHYLVSAALSFCVAVIVNYALNRIFNFKSKNKQVLKQFTKFLTVALIGLALNEILLFLFVDRLGLHYLLAKPMVMVIIAPVSFVLHLTFSFRQVK